MRTVHYFAAFAALSLSAQAFAGPVSSLNDLPQKWEGVAGDLVVRVPAKLNIGRITKVTRNEGGSYIKLHVVYEVEATLSVGERVMAVKTITLLDYLNVDDIYELNIALDDELTPFIQTSVRYDEATNVFTMREYAVNGARRLSMTGRR